MSEGFRLVIAVLCTWRLTHLLQAEDGPWDFSVRLRRAAGDGLFAQALDCFYCLSLWIALAITTLFPYVLVDKLLLWPALSGGAILLQRFSERHATTNESPTAEFHEDELKG